MMMGTMVSTVLQEGLTARGIWTNIPTDPASIFVYVLLAVAVGWVVWGSRKKKTPTS